MSVAVTLIIVSVFLIELFLFYAPLYLITYKLFHLDKVVGDSKLAKTLMSTSVILSVAFLLPISSYYLRLIGLI